MKELPIGMSNDQVPLFWNFLRHMEALGVYTGGLIRRQMISEATQDVKGPLPPPEGFEVQELIDIFSKVHQGEDAKWKARHKAIKLFGIPDDPGLNAASDFVQKSNAKLAQLEVLSLAVHFPNASDDERQLFKAARDTLIAELSNFTDEPKEPGGLVERILGAINPPEPPQVNVMGAVIRATVLERALSTGVDIDQAERDERARWE